MRRVSRRWYTGSPRKTQESVTSASTSLQDTYSYRRKQTEGYNESKAKEGGRTFYFLLPNGTIASSRSLKLQIYFIG